ncbi:rhomboid family intramembrane serine protease [Gilvimarinus sp. SDUM040013]|uniref:Rhomboid family intramembrane serine protease n=1 Tax=Gilvimarinus gilvus TaxID=3058038 RepID=A0ABU4RVG4_9GAMM|nr:rhomboid family intramembrane serine protease [Gilvimarinus sp. SDUM040013]MDO3387696.1 rhomboid family intramembrane serine protease [Gilvimarinus sp. SDUM040013]MDX6848863.1 rhomboid family intramembrane serine protease [Gilvimarinus sp. SDUM040013]
MLLLAVHIINLGMGGELIQYGIIPRDKQHWFGVLTAPFIHASYSHLLNNIIGLSVLAGIFLLRSIRQFFTASVFIIVVGGTLVWAFGRNAVHIGASGWIFGLWSFLIVAAWFERSLKSFAIAMLVVFLYGGMIYGVLPTREGVSFESHLFGALAGIIFSAIVGTKKLGCG